MMRTFRERLEIASSWARSSTPFFETPSVAIRATPVLLRIGGSTACSATHVVVAALPMQPKSHSDTPPYNLIASRHAPRRVCGQTMMHAPQSSARYRSIAATMMIFCILTERLHLRSVRGPLCIQHNLVAGLATGKNTNGRGLNETRLLPAIAASTLLASAFSVISPNSLPPKPSNSQQATQAAQATETRKARKVVVRGSIVTPEAVTIGIAPATIAASRHRRRTALRFADRNSCGVERHSGRARASRDRAREPLSRQRDGPRRRQRADADQARDRARDGLFRQRRGPARSRDQPHLRRKISRGRLSHRGRQPRPRSRATMRAATTTQRSGNARRRMHMRQLRRQWSPQ